MNLPNSVSGQPDNSDLSSQVSEDMNFRTFYTPDAERRMLPVTRINYMYNFESN